MALTWDAVDRPFSIAGVVTLVTFVFLSRWLYKSNMRTAKFPPGPPTLPILGNIHQMPTKHPFLKYTEWSRRYGDIIGLKVGPLNIIILNSPEVIQSLFVHRASIYSGRPLTYLVQNFIYRNQDPFLLFQNDAKLKRARTSLRSLTGPAGLKEALPMQDRIASKLIDRLGERSYEPETCLGLWSFETAMTATMGPVGAEIARPEILQKWTVVEHQLLGAIESAVAFLYDIIPAVRYLPGSPGKSSAEAIGKTLYGFYNDCLCSLKRHMSHAERPENNGNYWGLMATIMRSQRVEDDTEHHANAEKIDSLFTESFLTTMAQGITDAATDTTTSVALSLILALAVNRDLLRKAQVEVDELCDRNQKNGPEYSDIGKLPYLKACILETLRWRVPVPLLLPHRLEKDDIFRGYHLPKDSVIMANVWAISQDSKHFSNPDVFDPDRFMGDDLKARSFHPFGLGRRVCPGDQFAINSLMVTFSKLIRNFDFVLDGHVPDLSVEGGYSTGIVTSPKSLPVHFVPRKL